MGVSFWHWWFPQRNIRSQFQCWSQRLGEYFSYIHWASRDRSHAKPLFLLPIRSTCRWCDGGDKYPRQNSFPQQPKCARPHEPRQRQPVQTHTKPGGMDGWMDGGGWGLTGVLGGGITGNGELIVFSLPKTQPLRRSMQTAHETAASLKWSLPNSNPSVSCCEEKTYSFYTTLLFNSWFWLDRRKILWQRFWLEGKSIKKKKKQQNTHICNCWYGEISAEKMFN